jgi:hypothetical protein
MEGLSMSSRPMIFRRPRIALRAVAVLGLALAFATQASAQVGTAPTAVKVERVRPPKEKHATLRFLKENRDFIRARFDRLREVPRAGRGDAAEIDPGLLAYSGLLKEVLAAQDTVNRAEDERARRHLLESINQLGRLESELDVMEHLLGDQRVRLAMLEDDFTRRQSTALMIVLSGYPSGTAVTEVAVAIDDGPALRVPLSPEQCASLKRGGIVEILHGFVEPREQVVQVTITGEAWPAGDSGYVTLYPMRDRLTFLRLDLSAVQPAQGGASIQASTWLHEAKPQSVGG